MRPIIHSNFPRSSQDIDHDSSTACSEWRKRTTTPTFQRGSCQSVVRLDLDQPTELDEEKQSDEFPMNIVSLSDIDRLEDPCSVVQSKMRETAGDMEKLSAFEEGKRSINSDGETVSVRYT
eukprot:CAMPEP_0184686670 /NCGR_PEP_ID=MMETSP0312-20130426/23491_1 /TAXON_ID=31354 /ORGANISM="Compsopogon coeruleus, Strain SAG 36.94" /LENGTH=120 /DNA_ID=CAMNT_0027142009 /DNA_START=459 /DNA_END=821 /DNA_ORIENTATION=-